MRLSASLRKNNFDIDADDVAKETGNGAHVLVPENWMGSKVKVIRLRKE